MKANYYVNKIICKHNMQTKQHVNKYHVKRVACDRDNTPKIQYAQKLYSIFTNMHALI